MIKAVIFDMDGLLVDSEPYWRVAETNCFATVGVKLNDDMCKQTMGMRIDEVVDYWFDRFPWRSKSTDQLTIEIVNEMDRLLALSGKPMPGVAHAFQVCKDMGLKMGLASSSRMQLIKTVVKKLNLEEDLDVIRSAENEVYGKPHPAVFMQTAEDLNVAPEDCLVLEDSIHGAIAGLAAKMKVIGVPDKDDFENEKFSICHYKLRSLNELTPSIIASL